LFIGFKETFIVNLSEKEPMNALTSHQTLSGMEQWKGSAGGIAQCKAQLASVISGQFAIA